MPLSEGQLIGKYRRLLLPHARLPEEAEELALPLELLLRTHTLGKCDDAAFAFWFVLLFTESRTRLCAPSSHRSGASLTQKLRWLIEADCEMPEAGDTLKNLHAFGMPGMIWSVFDDWLSGRAPLQLVKHPVSTRDMLTAQANGFRYVTIDTDAAVGGRTVCETRDAFEFALHDLGHAYAFFLSEYEPDGQVIFFQSLRAELRSLEPLARADKKFAADLEYCMADMNTHPEHLRQYLRGVIIEAYYRQRQNSVAVTYSETAMGLFLESFPVGLISQSVR
jgi:hypothetical protein